MAAPTTGVDGAINSINQSGEDQLKIATAVQAAAAKGAAASGIIGAAQSLSNTACLLYTSDAADDNSRV